MQFFLVGGAVRDGLLDYPFNERDWVVVGASPELLLQQGYRQVGTDFPVFLHPQTNEEYALARTERKSGKGYHGFSCDFSPHITLEQDLARRDLTINAIAKDANGNLIDPFDGQKDLEKKCLRHVTDAFAEDPLRVLRVARFAARYHHLGFTIAKETFELMTSLATSGELDALTPERIWQETSKAISEQSPHIYFQVLHDCRALKAFFPELDILWGIPNPARWHPEIDSGVHTMMVLQQAAQLSSSIPVRFAALCHDLGKGQTDPSLWPSHPGHEKAGVLIIGDVCKRLKVPNECKQLAQLASEYHLHCHRAFELKASTLVDFIDRCGAYKKPKEYQDFLLTCEADFLGRTGFEDRPYPQRDLLIKIADATKVIDSKPFVEKGLAGPAIGNAIREQRISIVKNILQKEHSSDKNNW